MFDLSFINPGMLAAMAGGAAPLLIHFLARKKPRLVRFPAVRFIKQSAKASSTRFRLKHLLLLAIRALLIILFALVVARPVIQASWLPRVRGAVARTVMILDDSFSMQYIEQGVSHMSKSRELATRILSDLEVGSEVALLRTSNPVGGFSIDLSSVVQEVQQTEASDDGRPCWEAIQRASELVRRPYSGNKAAFLITDMARAAWRGAPQTSVWPEDVPLWIIDVGAKGARNLAVVGLKTSRTRAGKNALLTIQSDVLADDIRDARKVALYINDRLASQRVVDFGKGAEHKVEFDHSFDGAGLQQGFVEIAGRDPLLIDNRRYFTINVEELPRVLCVNGAAEAGPRDELFYWLRAASPPTLEDRPVVLCTVVQPGELAKQELAEYSAVIIANAPSLEPRLWAALSAWARRGGGLAFFAGDKAGGEDIDGFKTAGLFPWGPIRKPTVGTAVRLAPPGYRHPLLAPFAGGRNGDLGAPVFSEHVTLNAKGDDVVLRFDNGSPAAVEQSLGRGKVMAFAFPIDADWSDFPLHPAYVPFVHELIRYLRGVTDAPSDFRVGGVVSYRLPIKVAQRTVGVVSPDETRQLQAPLDPESNVVTFAETTHPGPYRFRVESAEAPVPIGFSVNVDPAESRLARISPDDLKRAFGRAAVHVGSEPPSLGDVLSLGPGRVEVHLALSGLLLILLIAESFVANRLYES